MHERGDFTRRVAQPARDARVHADVSEERVNGGGLRAQAASLVREKREEHSDEREVSRAEHHVVERVFAGRREAQRRNVFGEPRVCQHKHDGRDRRRDGFSEAPSKRRRGQHEQKKAEERIRGRRHRQRHGCGEQVDRVGHAHERPCRALSRAQDNQCRQAVRAEKDEQQQRDRQVLGGAIGSILVASSATAVSSNRATAMTRSIRRASWTLGATCMRGRNNGHSHRNRGGAGSTSAVMAAARPAAGIEGATGVSESA